MFKTKQTPKISYLVWLEWSVILGFILVAIAAVFTTFLLQRPENGERSVFSQLESRADALSREADPIRRDAMCIPLSSFARSIDAQLPTNSRVFLLDMLGPENSGKLGYYYFLNNYLYPREVALSFGKPATFQLDKSMAGQNPASIQELAQAGYDLVLKQSTEGGWQSQVLKPISPKMAGDKTANIAEADKYIVLLLPVALALIGSRLIRWLFKDLIGVLTMGEWLACGLAAGIFLLTQLTLALRMMGMRPEQLLAISIMTWAVIELIIFIRGGFIYRPQLKTSCFWWCLLIPAGLMLLCLFRLSGLEGLQDFDAIAFWEFKAKLLYNTAGREIWKWTCNPALGYAHLDYPLTVPLLYSFTFGALGHINEFVIKLWNQWMIFFLAAAIGSAGHFPNRRPWLTASIITAIVLLPITLTFDRFEGGTIPLFFFVTLAFIEMALGLADKQQGRLKLGLFLLMGAAMVKLEGGMLLGIVFGILLLHKESRALLWPIGNSGVAALIGLVAWLPYLVFRSHVSIVHPDTLGPGVLLHEWNSTLHFAPMTWISLVSGRLLNNEFVSWTAPDNEHVVWNGKWSGLESLVDGSTLGLGWLALLTFILLLFHANRLRWVAICFFLTFLIYTVPICIECLSAAIRHPQGSQAMAIVYSAALDSANRTDGGGRYLFPILISWLATTSIVLSRQEKRPNSSPSKRNNKTA